MMSGLVNHYRERTVACFIARAAPPDAAMSASTLPAYGPVAEEASLRERLAPFDALEGEERETAITEAMDGVRTAEEVVLLGEIHPSWLVDILVHESPRVVGLLMRFLPSQHARYILEHLPRTLRERLPQIVDAFAVSDQILRIVRRRFEAHFLPMRPLTEIKEFTIDQLHYVAMDDLLVVLHDIGLHELAMAFRGISHSTLRVLLNRLPFDEAKALVKRIESLGKIDAAMERDARFAILEMSFEGSQPETLLREVGLQALSKALGPQHLEMVALLRQKLPPALAYLLQRDAEIHIPHNHAEVAAQRRHQILLRVGALAREGHIEPKWLRLLPEVVQHDPHLVEDGTQRITVAPEESEGQQSLLH
jgi:hypothetical protein